jgi:hypothetical protein
VPRLILNELGERIGDLVDKEPFPPFSLPFGFQIEIKENKTPGDEHYLDPPGVELLAWSKN